MNGEVQVLSFHVPSSKKPDDSVDPGLKVYAQRFIRSANSCLICSKRSSLKALADLSSAVCPCRLQYRAFATWRSLISPFKLARRSEKSWTASVLTLAVKGHADWCSCRSVLARSISTFFLAASSVLTR